MGVLGESSPFRDQGIESFSNENFLRFKYHSSNLATKTKTVLKATTSDSSPKDCSSFLTNALPPKNKRIARLTKYPLKYWTPQLSTTISI